ncbi:MAG: YfhO family protein, partial [Nitrospiraceae bacterium]
MRFLARRAPSGILAGADSSSGPAVAALLIISLTFYHRLWLPDLVLIKRDAFRYFLPLKQYIIERLTAGELPQWLPYEGFGRPFLGASGIGLFHPFTALYFLLPVPDAYRAATLVSCVLAGLGAFAIGRALELSRAGALLAGVAFALSGYVVSLTDNLLYLYSICVLPLFCAGLEKALRQSLPWVVAPAVVWATVFLNGDVQTGYYYGCIAIVWTMARAPGSYQAASVRLALILGLTALLAGIQLGPAAAAYAGSERAQPAIFRDQALQWSMHPLRLLTVAASPVGGDADPVEVSHRFFGSRPAGEFPVELWAESLYLGVPVLGLAWLGTRHRRDLRGLALLGGLALVLALGRYGGLYELFFHVVPLWSSFRYPEKLMGVASLSAALLAGAGLDVLGAAKGRPPLWFAMGIACVGAWLVFRSDGISLWIAAAFHAPEALAHAVTDSAALAFLLSAVASVVVGLILVGVHRGWLGWELAHALLIVVIVVDLSRVNLGAYHTGPLEAATFTPGLVEAIRQHAGVL